MQPKSCLAVLVILAGWAGSAGADPVTMQAQCSIDSASATACRIEDEVAADGRHHMAFVVGDKRLHFVGKTQTGWWSGELDGKPAMGYERNRGYVVFSTTDLGTTFEWWTKGNEHGSY